LTMVLCRGRTTIAPATSNNGAFYVGKSRKGEISLSPSHHTRRRHLLLLGLFSFLTTNQPTALAQQNLLDSVSMCVMLAVVPETFGPRPATSPLLFALTRSIIVSTRVRSLHLPELCVTRGILPREKEHKKGCAGWDFSQETSRVFQKDRPPPTTSQPYVLITGIVNVIVMGGRNPQSHKERSVASWSWASR